MRFPNFRWIVIFPTIACLHTRHGEDERVSCFRNLIRSESLRETVLAPNSQATSQRYPRKERFESLELRFMISRFKTKGYSVIPRPVSAEFPAERILQFRL